ncbi:hypothetical protein CPC16_004156 [Podila verticillata]|nr:hypothetical protein BGZ52_003981 [Haplosporangium bisporale]KAF9369824.1 hypothetical protein CPC16_004156 [Podila verticillata]KAI9237900.1 MAG: hypothetical protein BYD32DRAFT_415211 [Podila humilis]KFH67575.1 hypothetical protein MVEG_06307 [Podila verticillata NRRL 6337]
MTSIKDTHFATKEALLRHVSERCSLQMVAVAVVESKNDRHGDVRMIKFGCRYHDLFCKANTEDSPPPPRKRARDSKDKSSSSSNHNHNNNNNNNECPFFWVASHCNGDWYLDPYVDTHSHPQPTRLEMEQALHRELRNYYTNNEIVFKPSEETPMEAVSPVPAPLDLQPVEASVPTPPKEPIVEAKPVVETKPVPPKPNTTPAPESPPQKPPATIMTPNLTRALDLAKVLVASITGSTPPTTNDARHALAEEILQILDREHAMRPLSKEMTSLKISVQSLRQKVMPLAKATPPNVSTSGSAASSLPSPPTKPCEVEVASKTPSEPTMVKST